MKAIVKTQATCLAICSILFATSGCKKYLTVDAPNYALETVTVFADSASASSAIVGIYSRMTNGNTGFLAAKSRFPCLAADEISFSGTGELQEILNNNIQTSNSLMNTLWINLYAHIYQANAAIEGINLSKGIVASAKATLTAEAKLIRALCYFNLVNYWGDVPLITGTDYRQNAVMARTQVFLIYQQIVSDLTDASTNLPSAYVSSERARPNKWTASALLSRAHLYQKNYAAAEANATIVINAGVYRLDSLVNVFLAGSNETIWQVIPVSAFYNSIDGSFYVPAPVAAAPPNYPLTNQLVLSFEANDGRRFGSSAWVGSKTVGGQTYYYPNKYKQRSATTPRVEHEIILRLAEQFLIRAEARAYQNNLSGAIADINVIRSRAKLSLLPNSLLLAQVLSAVEQERKVELFTEWGHRWFDLKRSERAHSVLSSIKASNWQATDTLWPIPISQLLTNPHLKQNNGY